MRMALPKVLISNASLLLLSNGRFNGLRAGQSCWAKGTTQMSPPLAAPLQTLLGSCTIILIGISTLIQGFLPKESPSNLHIVLIINNCALTNKSNNVFHPR